MVNVCVQYDGIMHYHCFFKMSCGVRQGGVLSPVLFAVYVDDILRRLSASGLGCFLGDFQLGYIMYADDLVLISSSLLLLQKMIKICETEATDMIWFSMHPSPCYCVLVVAITEHVLMLVLAVMLFQL